MIWKQKKNNEGAENDGGRALEASATLLGHSDYVTSLCPLPSSSSSASASTLSTPSLLSGGRDAVGILWDVAAAEPAARLGPGAHKWAVSAVAARPAAESSSSSSSSAASADAAALFTASLDGTVAEWDFSPSAAAPSPPLAPSRILKGHEGPVQACLVLPGSRALVSASSDRSVRVWLPSAGAGQAGAAAAPAAAEGSASLLPSVAPSAVLKDAHDDTVRGLALLPSEGREGKFLLVSVGHDSLVKLWALPPALLSSASSPPSSAAELTPTLAATLVGHTALVYAAAAASPGEEQGGTLPSPLLATASEDATARVWDGSHCVSVLRHPGCVWACAWLPDGDLATACADGVVRLWTRRGSGREAPAEEREALAAALAARDEEQAAAAAGGGGGGAGASASASASALPAGLKLSDPSILSQPGRPGQNAVVRDPATGAAAVFEFDAPAGEWTKLGDVVGGADGGDTVAGGSSKWHAGRQWDHVFDVDVADGAPPLKLPYNDGENPYDAADRFLEREQLPQAYRQQVVEHIIACTGGKAGEAVNVSVNVDPFTGGGAYVPGTAMAPGGGFAGAAATAAAAGAGSVTGGGADPFTGTAASAAPAAAAPAPQRAYVLFDAQPRAEAVAAKARDLAAAAAAAPPPLLSASDDVEALVAVAVASAAAASFQIPAASLALLDRMLDTWPASALFPVLDIARLVALSEQGSSALAASASASSVSAPSTLRGLSRALAAALAEDSPAPAKVTAARLVANAVRHPQLRALVTARAAELAGLLAPVIAVAAAAGDSGAAVVATAAASSAAALHNLCLSVASSDSSPDPARAAKALLAAAAEVLKAGGPELIDDAVGGFAAGGAAALAAASRANAAVAADLGLKEAAASLLLSLDASARPKLSEAARELARVLDSSSS